MKWIGQYIYDQISRFRNDVYLEDISSGTIASGGNLGLDSNNKIVKESDTGITDLHGAGVDGSNNQLLTDDGDGTITSEANLTFDGSTLIIEADSNTTASALFIDANSLTTTNLVNIDVDDALTTTATRTLHNIDYYKSSSTPNTITNTTAGSIVKISDAGSNHGGSAHVLNGYIADISKAGDDGSNSIAGFQSNISVSGVSVSTGRAIEGVQSYYSNIIDTIDGGVDFKAVSSADNADYFTIATQTNGATTLTTVDGGAAAANLTMAIDGNIAIKSAVGRTFFYVTGNDDDYCLLDVGSNGDTKITTVDAAGADAHFKIEADGNIILDPQTSTTGVQIDGTANTTANTLEIDCDSLTTGSAVFIDVDDALTASASKKLMFIDYDKSGVTADGATSNTHGLEINMNDAATNHANGTVTNVGVNVSMDFASNQGTITQTGFAAKLTDADYNTGFSSWIEDGAAIGWDFVAYSSANSADNAYWQTGANGATTIGTTDGSGHNLAHYEVAASGNITLDAAGDIALECGGGDLTCDADTVTFESANADDPQFIIKNTTADNQGARFQLRKDRGAAMADNDRIGEIDFFGEDASQNTQQYAKIIVQAVETDHGSETGKMDFKVAEYDGTVGTGLLLTGQDADGEIDVEIAKGVGSTTTIAGDLVVNGDSLIFESPDDSEPVVQIKNTNSNTSSAELHFVKDKGAAGADGDELGIIKFYGDDAGQTQTYFGHIKGAIATAADGSEGGSIKLAVASHDGEIVNGLQIVDGDLEDEVDVTIGNTVTSLTTIAGGLTVTSGATINNPSDGATSALIIDNDDVDQKAIDIDAENTTANIINMQAQQLTTGNGLYINCDSLTTGHPIRIDVDTSHTLGYDTNIMEIDYDKTGVTASGQTQRTTGLDLRLRDTATNHASGTVTQKGLYVKIDQDDATGTITQTGIDLAVGGTGVGDAATTTGIDMIVMDGGTDIICRSHADTGDYFSIQTTTHGATTLTTEDDNATAAHFEVAADGNITLDAAADIALESGSDSTNSVSIDHRKFAVSSSTDGDANGDVVYFGGTTSMTVGKIYHYKSDGTWEIANADAVATADGLLGVALGAASDTNGMLLRGMVTLDHDPGAIGDVLYVQSDNAGTPGDATATVPSASGDCVRIIGYQVSHASNGNIWFNPDNTFVEVA